MKLRNTVLSVSFVGLLGVLAPSYIDGHYKQVNAIGFSTPFSLAVKAGTATLKKWLVYVSAREGGRAALSSLKALKSLPQDPLFRASVLSALAGGNYAEAKSIASDVAREAAVDSVKTNLSNGAVFDGFKQFNGNRVEEAWNDANDKLTCGEANIELAVDNNGKYHVLSEKNEGLLEGRALLQRAIYTRLISNSSFQSDEEALRSAERYSKYACRIGASNKLMALIGGFSLNKGVITSSVERPVEMFNKLTVWAENELYE
jgi:hypothetical protein